MGLPDGHDFVHKDRALFDLVECGEHPCNMEAIDLHAGPEIQQFLVAS
jgi:hypothetical protein